MKNNSQDCCKRRRRFFVHFSSFLFCLTERIQWDKCLCCRCAYTYTHTFTNKSNQNRKYFQRQFLSILVLSSVLVRLPIAIFLSVVPKWRLPLCIFICCLRFQQISISLYSSFHRLAFVFFRLWSHATDTQQQRQHRQQNQSQKWKLQFWNWIQLLQLFCWKLNELQIWSITRLFCLTLLSFVRLSTTYYSFSSSLPQRNYVKSKISIQT